jgi:hypothetical protein
MYDGRPVVANGAYASVDPRQAQQNGAYHDVLGGVGSFDLGDESDEETGYQELDGTTAHYSGADVEEAGYQDFDPYMQPAALQETGYMAVGEKNYDNVERTEDGYDGLQMDHGYAHATATSNGEYDQPGNIVLGYSEYDQPNPPPDVLYDNPEHLFLRRDSRA